MSLMENNPEDMPEANDDPDVEGHSGGLPEDFVEDMPEAHDEEPDVEGHIGGLPENLLEDRIKDKLE